MDGRPDRQSPLVGSFEEGSSYNYKLCAVETLCARVMNLRVRFAGLPDSDPESFGLQLVERGEASDEPTLFAGRTMRSPVRVYMNEGVILRILEAAPDLLSTIMDILLVDRLVVQYETASHDDELSLLVSRLAALGFRSPKMSLDGVLGPTVRKNAISFVYVRRLG